MDEIEGGILAAIPPAALSLTLTRSTIRMEHSHSWSIDKSNAVEDLLICLEGRGEYLVEGERLVLAPGEALLLPRDRRFQGHNPGTEVYRGIAQHFTLQIFGRHNLIAQMRLRRKVALSRWPLLEPLARHYRRSAPPSSVTLGQHHLFMLFLIAYIDDAFLGWGDSASWQAEGSDALDLAVMKAAAMISASPLLPGIAEAAVAGAPYNRDYFLREFQKRVGRTPRKYQEFKRMERAMHLLETGLPVSATASEVGYADPYYFSRMFKRTMGLSPRDHIRQMERVKHGRLMRYDEVEQAARLSG